MKRFMYALVAMAMLFGSCHGQIDDSVELQLVPSATSIVADGEQEVTFEVLYGTNVVSSEARITLVSHPELGWSGSSFSTTEQGEYVFQASYRDILSKEVKIVANEAENVESSRFERHILAMDFTGTWCSWCPGGFRDLNYFATRNKWNGYVHIVAMHDSETGEDPMGLSLTNTIHRAFSLDGFPCFLIDMRDGGSLTDNLSDLVPSFERSVEEYPARSDVKITSTLAEGVVTAQLTLFAEQEGEWRVCAYLVENGIVAPQLDGSVEDKDYTHNHVVRCLMGESWRGDRLGNLSAESEESKTYTYTLEEEWVAENMSVVALAIDANGYVNNVAICPLSGSVDYKYIEE